MKSSVSAVGCMPLLGGGVGTVFAAWQEQANFKTIFGFGRNVSPLYDGLFVALPESLGTWHDIVQLYSDTLQETPQSNHPDQQCNKPTPALELLSQRRLPLGGEVAIHQHSPTLPGQQSASMPVQQIRNCGIHQCHGCS